MRCAQLVGGRRCQGRRGHTGSCFRSENTQTEILEDLELRIERLENRLAQLDEEKERRIREVLHGALGG